MQAGEPIRGPAEAHGVQSPDAYRALALAVGEQTRRFSFLRQAGACPAFVNCGRWLVRCICGNAPLASVDWRLAICLECGTEYEPSFPDNVPAIDALLGVRPERHRHWRPGEPAEALLLENIAHELHPGDAVAVPDVDVVEREQARSSRRRRSGA